MANKKLYLRKVVAIAICLAGITAFSGCGKERVTYRFTEKDKPKLLSHYIEGEVLTFVNEKEEERKFKIVKVEQRVVSQHWMGGGCGGNCHDWFYCEPKFFYLTDLATQQEFYFSLARFPIAQNEAEQDGYHLHPSSLFGLFATVSWFTYSFIFEFSFDEEVQRQRYSDNQFTYNNNMIIINFAKAGSWDEGGGMLTDAKVIYYDIYQGLMGFDDIKNQQWRLSNK